MGNRQMPRFRYRESRTISSSCQQFRHIYVAPFVIRVPERLPAENIRDEIALVTLCLRVAFRLGTLCLAA
jgi:hypothetical protein